MNNRADPAGAGHPSKATEFVESEAGRFVQAMEDFQDPSQEWRRLFSELLGTFLLVLVAAGGGMMGQASQTRSGGVLRLVEKRADAGSG